MSLWEKIVFTIMFFLSIIFVLYFVNIGQQKIKTLKNPSLLDNIVKEKTIKTVFVFNDTLIAKYLVS